MDVDGDEDQEDSDGSPVASPDMDEQRSPPMPVTDPRIRRRKEWDDGYERPRERQQQDLGVLSS